MSDEEKVRRKRLRQKKTVEIETALRIGKTNFLKTFFILYKTDLSEFEPESFSYFSQGA